MKKLSLAMAAAMCLTVGGVYATWNYASGGSVDPASATVNVTIEGATTLDKKGTINVTDNSFSLSLDQSTVGYQAIWLASGSKTVSFTFAANDITSIVLGYTVTVNTDLKYDVDGDGEDDQLFSLNSQQYNSMLAGKSYVDLGSFASATTAPITAQTISSYITITDKLDLETKEEYDAFKAYIDGQNIVTITVVEGNVSYT